MRTASIIVNAVIFLITFAVFICSFRKDGQWQLERGLKAFRYFTVLSNDFCALTALVMAFAQLTNRVSMPVVWLKYLGTLSVTITIITVFLFLGPTQGFGKMLGGENFFMHLVCPVLAIASFCLWEKRAMSLGLALTGLIPVSLYGLVYLYRVVYAPEGERWEDFYGFYRGGRWRVTAIVMLAGALAICVAYWLVCRNA